MACVALVRGVSLFAAPARPASYAFFFPPGLMPARTFLALSMSRPGPERDGPLMHQTRRRLG